MLDAFFFAGKGQQLLESIACRGGDVSDIHNYVSGSVILELFAALVFLAFLEPPSAPIADRADPPRGRRVRLGGCSGGHNRTTL